MRNMPSSSPNSALQQERLRQGWTQQDLADRLGTTKLTVGRWERGITVPGPYFRLKLCTLLGKDPQALGLLPEENNQPSQQASSDPPGGPEEVARSWNLPFRRNPFFTGREATLAKLRDMLHVQKTIAITPGYAISGLGGIGKTQFVLEYAYRFRAEYSVVLWARAETRTVLLNDLMALATVIGLPPQQERDQQHTLQAIQQWLMQHSDWLLILDNLEDMALLEEIAPSEIKGHLLFTTRAQATGSVAQHLAVEQMSEEEGALFLLRRAKRIDLHQSLEQVVAHDRARAQAIAAALDGLPLALDQAGAYIEETGCSLADYLERYRTSRTFLLNQRGGTPFTHPASVAATFALLFERVQSLSGIAVAILRVCAFLHPDAIPEELVAANWEGVEESVVYPDGQLSSIEFDQALAALRRFSLIRRQADTTILTIHRVVQAVIKDQMDEQMQRRWAERAVWLVSNAFPDVEYLITWSQCQRYLPHASRCIELIERWQFTLPEAIQLLMRTSAYLREQAQEGRANALTEQANTLRQESQLGQGNDMATDFFAFMRHTFYHGRYHTERAAVQEKIEQLEQTLGPEHPDWIYLLIGKAFLFYLIGQYDKAEEFYQSALTMENVSLLYQRLALSGIDGADALPHIAFVLGLLGQLYTAQGKYQQAEALFEQSLSLWGQYPMPMHLFKGPCLHGKAVLTLLEGNYETAQHFILEEQNMLEQVLGQDHPLLADNKNVQAQLAIAQGEHAKAELCLQQTMNILERTTGLHHPFAVQTFHLWSQLRLSQGDLEQAEIYTQQAVNISILTQGEAHPETVRVVNALAAIRRVARVVE